jgi:sugar (pentulose or hexulose) kinase
MTHTTPAGARAGGPAVLGIGLGTSSVKVVVANLEGDLIAQADAPCPVMRPHPGWSQTHPHVTHLYRSAAESGWYSMGAGLNSGSTLAWVGGILGASWQELYDCAAPSPTDDAPLFLPHLHGERTPYVAPGMRGAWTGLAPQHRREDLLYAALEGVAFAIRVAADCLLAPGHHVTELRLAGGGTTAHAWRQMLADILERPLTPIDVPGASALAAALLARRVAGLPGPTLNRTADPAGGWSNRATRPRPEVSRLHLVRYARYRERVATLRPRAAARALVRCVGRPHRGRALKRQTACYPPIPAVPHPPSREGKTGATMRSPTRPAVRPPGSWGSAREAVTFS